MSMTTQVAPNGLDAYWMPFTPNRRFKADPRFVERAEGMYYFTPDDAGSWTGRPASGA